MYDMNTATINITLPIPLKKAVEDRVKSGFYTSVSEFIRQAVRKLLFSADEIPYGPPFSPEATKEILKAEKEALEHPERNIVIKTPTELKRFFDGL